MDLNALIREKKKYSDIIKSEYKFPKNNKCIGLIKLSDEELLKELIKGLSFLPVNFIVVGSEPISGHSDNIVFISDISSREIGVDFVVFDSKETGLSKFFKKGIIPIVLRSSYFSPIISEFNPIKNEGNGFLYENLNEWSIFYTITRYLENYKFSFDNKNLVKNIFES